MGAHLDDRKATAADRHAEESGRAVQVEKQGSSALQTRRGKLTYFVMLGVFCALAGALLLEFLGCAQSLAARRLLSLCAAAA